MEKGLTSRLHDESDKHNIKITENGLQKDFGRIALGVVIDH